MKSFVSEHDIYILSKNGINYDEDIIVFINEMKNYLYKTWKKEYHTDIDKCGNTIEDFNKLISDYPSNSGYDILSNSFEYATDEDLEVLSEKTIELLGYFYNIHLN